MRLTRLVSLTTPFGPIPADADIDPPLTDCGVDILARGMAWLTDQLQAHLSQPVIYQRGALKVALCATFGRKLLRIDDGFGSIRMEWTDRDFLVPASKLKLGGQAVLPERGDRVKVQEGGVTHVYEVLAPGNEPPWRWCDPYRRMIRIHSKLIEES